MQDTDLSSVQELHDRMGMDYRFPDLRSPLFIVKNIAADEQDQIFAAMTLKIQAEAYLWVNPDDSPRKRWQAICSLFSRTLEDAYDQGIGTIVCWVPANVEESFAGGLERMGMTRDREGWHSWSREVER